MVVLKSATNVEDVLLRTPIRLVNAPLGAVMLNRTVETAFAELLVLSITVADRLKLLDWLPITMSDVSRVAFGAVTSFKTKDEATLAFLLLLVSFASMR